MTQRKRWYINICLLIVLLITLVGTSMAWLSKRRSITTATSIIAPYKLNIGAGNLQAIEELHLGNIDVKNINTDGTYSRDYVFCVYGSPATDYRIQLAYTTNIGFDYDVYRAQEPNETRITVTDAEFVGNDLQEWYFSRANNVPVISRSNIINLSADGRTASDGRSYSDGDVYQKNAKALYSQSDVIILSEQENKDNVFAHYYILRVKWNGSFTNNKETDIIYITVEGV